MSKPKGFTLMNDKSNRSPIIGTDRKSNRPAQTWVEDDQGDYEIIEEEFDDGEPARPTGCLWGLLGGLGCLAIPLGALAVVVILGINTFDGVLNNVIGIFDPPPATYTTLTDTLVLERVQNLSDLTTTRFNFTQNIVTERNLPAVLEPLYGEQLTLLAVGHVNAGVDLRQLTAEDITVEGNTLSMRLPPPTLQDCILNAQQTRVIDSDTGLFTADSNIQEMTQDIAIRRIREVALEEGILLDANESAQLALSEVLTLAFVAAAPEDAEPVQVSIIIRPPDPATMELPDTCR